uniref:Uncharacterized protein n=1 Tax=Lygus hesperus TaxID=30085 RepID=A0A146KVG7_LYGHE
MLLTNDAVNLDNSADKGDNKTKSGKGNKGDGNQRVNKNKKNSSSNYLGDELMNYADSNDDEDDNNSDDDGKKQHNAAAHKKRIEPFGVISGYEDSISCVGVPC